MGAGEGWGGGRAHLGKLFHCMAADRRPVTQALCQLRCAGRQLMTDPSLPPFPPPKTPATPSMAPPSSGAPATFITTTGAGAAGYCWRQLGGWGSGFQAPCRDLFADQAPSRPPPPRRPLPTAPARARRSGLQQQFVLYTQASLAAGPSVLLDPNTLSDDGTVALRDAAFSDDGNLLAYQARLPGSHRNQCHHLMNKCIMCTVTRRRGRRPGATCNP